MKKSIILKWLWGALLLCTCCIYSNRISAQTNVIIRATTVTFDPTFCLSTFCHLGCTGKTYTLTVTNGGLPCSTPPLSPATGYTYTVTTIGTSCVYSITFTSAGSYTVTADPSKCVEILQKPIAKIGSLPVAVGGIIHICRGDSVFFWRDSTGCVQSWDFGDGGVSSAASVSHRYTMAGTYTVLLIVYNCFTDSTGGDGTKGMSHTYYCCPDSALIKVIVDTAIGIDIACIKAVCAGDTGHYCVQSPIAGCIYTWTLPGGTGTLVGTTSTPPCATVKWGNGPFGEICVKTNCGCPNPSCFEIPIFPSNGFHITGDTVPCSSSVLTYFAPPVPGATYSWSIRPVGATWIYPVAWSKNIIQVTWPSSGTFWIVCHMSHDLLPCTGVDSIKVTIKPELSIIAAKTITCQGDSLSFSASPTSIVNWKLIGGSGTLTGVGSTYHHVFTIAGTYILKAFSSTYCDTAIVVITIKPTPPPITISGPSSYPHYALLGCSYTYTTTATGIVTWVAPPTGTITAQTSTSVTIVWSGLPGVVSGFQTIDSCVGPMDTFQVKPYPAITITGHTSGCSDSAHNSYSISYLPPNCTNSWSLTPSSYGSVIAGLGTNAVDIQWHIVTSPTVITISDTIRNTCTGAIFQIVQITVTIYPRPVINLTGNLFLCQGSSASLTASILPGIASTWQWDNGGTLNADIYSYPASGSHWVKVVDNHGCSSEDFFNITEVPTPSVSISLDTVPTCSGSLTTSYGSFIASTSGTGATYSWSSPLVSYGPNCPRAGLPSGSTLPGTFTVTATFTFVYDGDTIHCSSTASITLGCPILGHGHGGGCTCPVTLTPSVSCNTASVTATVSGCSFTPSSPISLFWGDGTSTTLIWGTSYTPSPATHTYSSPGIYYVSACGTNVKVTIYSVINFKVVDSGCCKTLIDLSSFLPGATYSLTSIDWGDGTSTTPNKHHCYASAGTYSVTEYYTVNGVSCSATISVTYTPPTIDFTTIPTPVCVGSSVSFTPTSTMGTFDWNFGHTNAHSALVSPSHTFLASGDSLVILTYTTPGGCTLIASHKIHIVKAAPINISSNSPHCAFDTIYLKPASSVSSVTWSHSVNPAPTITTVTADSTGAYIATLHDINGCLQILSTNIVVRPLPSATIVGPSSICLGSTVTTSVSLSPSIYTLHWTVAGYTYTSTTNILSFTPTSAGTYNISLIIKDTCIDTLHYTVIVHPNPKVSISFSPDTLCEGQPDTLKAIITTTTTGPYSYYWSTSATTSSIIVRIPGNYSVIVTDAYGCTADTMVSPLLQPLPDLTLFPIGMCDSTSCKSPGIIHGPAGYAYYTYYIDHSSTPVTTTVSTTGPYVVGSDLYYFCDKPPFNDHLYHSVTIVVQTSHHCTRSQTFAFKCSKCPCSCPGQFESITLSTTVPPISSIPVRCDSSYAISCNTAYTLGAYYFCSGNCTGSVTYKMIDPAGFVTTGSLSATITATMNGIYHITVYGYCGTTKCDSCNFTLVCNNCPCKCPGTWGGITLAISASSTTSIKCDSSYNVKCNTAYNLSAIYNCTANCAGTVTYRMTDPLGVVTTGSLSATVTPSLTGAYHITIYGYCGGKLCDSCRFTLISNCPCKCPGTWGGITLAASASSTTTVKCDSSYNVSCNTNYTLSASYTCTNSCAGTTKYKMTDPGGTVTSGTLSATISITMNGAYHITVYGYCGSTLCDSCRITLVCNNCPCKCPGTWGAITLKASGGSSTTISCGNSYTVSCNTAYTLAAIYNCSANCTGSATYKMTDPSSVVTSGSLSTTITPTQNGTYYITLYGHCGSSICDSCKFTLQCSGCPCTCPGTWGTITLKTGTSSTTISCGNSYTVSCNTAYTLAAAYTCKASCAGTVTYKMTDPSSVVTTGSLSTTITPSQNGTYFITLYGHCGTSICDSCKFTLQCSGCPCVCPGTWGTITLKTGTSSTTISCANSYTVSCNTAYILAAAYTCKASCAGTVTYKMTDPSSVVTTGSLSTTITPSQNGTYFITLYGHCGTSICDSCKFTLQCSGCPCVCPGTWGAITLKKAGSLPTVITCANSYIVNCNTAYTLAAIYTCKGSCVGAVTYKMTDPSSVVTTGTLSTTIMPSQNGTYFITLYGHCGTSICDSCKFTLNCSSCPCVCPGTWGAITLKTGTTTTSLSCGNSYAVSCHTTYTLSALYTCKAGCAGTTTYKMIDPLSVVTTGAMPTNITPSINGTYSITIYGHCGNSICDSCKITLKCTNCKCLCPGTWGKITLASVALINVNCNSSYPVKCHTTYILTAPYTCTAGCTGNTTYKMKDPLGAITTGPLPNNITPTMNGTYFITIYAHCGTTLCDSCTFALQCSGCKRVLLAYSPSSGLEQPLDCDSNYTLHCGVSTLINGSYMCDSSCDSTIYYSYTDPLGIVTTGTLPFTVTPHMNGTYTLLLYGTCNGQSCDSCNVTFTVSDCQCKCPGQWGSLSLNDSANSTPVQCGSTVDVKCNHTYTFDGSFSCTDTSCNGVAYEYTDPLGSTTIGYLPLTTTPNLYGSYTLTLFGLCGSTVCDSCTITLITDCPGNTPPPPVTTTLKHTKPSIGIKNSKTPGDSYKVYPNPSTGMFTIEMEAYNYIKNNATLEIYDVLGTRLYKETIANETGYIKHDIDLNKLSAGSYILHVTMGSKLYITRVVITH